MHERAASGATSQPLLQVLGVGSTNTTQNTIPHPLLHVPAALGGSSSTLVTRAARLKHPKVAHGGFGRMLYSKGPWSHPWPFIQPKPLDFCAKAHHKTENLILRSTSALPLGTSTLADLWCGKRNIKIRVRRQTRMARPSSVYKARCWRKIPSDLIAP